MIKSVEPVQFKMNQTVAHTYFATRVTSDDWIYVDSVLYFVFEYVLHAYMFVTFVT